MAAGTRLRFLGSSVSINLSYTASKVITAITRTNPGVATSAAHGMLNGAVGLLSGVVGMIELNDKLYVVDNVAANDFQLALTNTTAYAAYVSGGTFAPVFFSSFCELTSITQQDGTANETEVTTICSTAKEFELGVADAGTLQMDYNFAPREPIQAALRAAKVSGAQIAIKVQFPGNGGTVIMFGAVQQQNFTGSVGSALWTGSATIKLSGDLFILQTVTLPGPVATVTAGVPTTTTQPLTWSASTGGTAPITYSVAFRLGVSTGGYTVAPGGGAVAGLAFTVTGLTSATAYDYQVTPNNVVGAGVPGLLNDAVTA